MSWSMPARRALNATYVALIEGRSPDDRQQIDAILNPPPPPTAADRQAALRARAMAFAVDNGGEIG